MVREHTSAVDKPTASPRGHGNRDGFSRDWIAGLTIWGALLIATALIQAQWRNHEPSSEPVTQRAVPKAAENAQPPSPSPALTAVQPEAEAAQLKREAITVAEQVAGTYANDALAYALLGSAFYNTGHSDEAIKHLRRSLELRPDQADAYEILARVAYDKGELEETVRLCQEALKRGPATPDLLNRLGRAQMDLGRTEEAIQVLDQASRLPKATSESRYLLAQAQMQSGDFAQAKENFRRAITLLPDHTQAHFGLYTACLRLGQAEEAGRYRAQFQTLEAKDRKELTDRSARKDMQSGLPMVRETVARTLFGAAQIYRVRQQPAKAGELFRRAAELDAENALYRSALEAFYIQGKNPAEGVKVFEQLTMAQPGNRLNHWFLGRLQTRLAQFDAAERSYQKVQELAPEWAEAYRAQAELYLRAERKLDQAQLLARKAIGLEPSPSNYYLLAVVCFKTNDRAGALKAVDQALLLKPDEKLYQQLRQQIQQTPSP